MVHLKVVLFCKGRGADASSYRPNRDESQWWNRRDALVRCVASFLYGPSSSSSSSNHDDSRELVLIHDEDWSVTHLALSPTHNSQPPTEQFVLSTIKAAILENNSNQNKKKNNLFGSVNTSSNENKTDWIERSGLKCRVVTNPDFAMAATAASHSSGGGNAKSSASLSIAGLDSKRQVLEHLQKVCSIDFLRTHGLNSSPAVLLRKTNKKTLVRIWYEWCKHGQSQKTSSTTQQKQKQQYTDTDDMTTNKNQQDQVALKSILNDLLQPQFPTIENVVAGLLHESLESELPCFGIQPNDMVRAETAGNAIADKSDNKLQVCLFLGAVRDMHSWENQVLQDTCCCRNFDNYDNDPTKNTSKNAIPLVKVRLGPIPEFTSKILSMVAYHQSQQLLGNAILQLVRQQKEKEQKQDIMTIQNDDRKRKRSEHDDNICDDEHDANTIPTTMHVVCPIPMSSKDLSYDLQDRNHLLWCLVRITVCTLWRSRVASSSSGSNNKTNDPMHLRTLLTFMFQDRCIMTFKQEDLVSSLAEQHQAAPSEYQILAALCRKRDELRDVVQEDVVKDWIEGTTTASTTHSSKFVIDIHTDNTNQNLHKLVHSLPNSELDGPPYETKSQSSVLVILNLNSSGINHLSTSNKSTQNTTEVSGMSFVEHSRKTILTACKRNNITVHYQSILEKGQIDNELDWEAANIVVLQHFAYQNRLIPCLCKMTTTREKESVLSKNNTTSNNDAVTNIISEDFNHESSKQKKKMKKLKKKKKKKERKHEKKDR